MGKGSNTTTTTQNSTYTPTGAPAINTALTAAQNAAATPYQAYGGELTAGINQQQQTGINNINSAASLAQPYYNTAQQYATAAGQPLTQAQIQQYQNPYTQSVVNATQAQFNNQNQQQQSSLLGNAAAQGALGGDRSAVAQANLAGQQSAAQAPVIAGLYNQSYAQGLATAQQQQQQQGTAAGILGGLGTGAQAAGLSGAGAQIGAGTLQQQTQQAQDTSSYQQFLNQLAYPFQTSQFLTQATAGLAPSLGGTTNGTGTSTSPAPSALGQILGGVATAASFLPSDERIKENKQAIGKMFDGTPIYRFNYKGDNTTRVGLLAQDVERKNPDAVAQTPGGVKMVDHLRATDDAASRQHFASGGVALPYGGAQGYVPAITSINAAQAPMPQMPGTGGGGGQQQPDQTNSIVNSMGNIGKSLKNSSIFSPGLGDDGLGNMNDYTWDGGTPLDGGAAIGMGGIGHAARGGRIRGYDDGGLVPSQDDPSGFDTIPPAPFASYFDPASPVAGGVNAPLNLPKSAGFEPKPDTSIPTPADSGMAAITQGVPLGDLPSAVGFDPPVRPVDQAPTDQAPLMAAAHLDTGAPVGPIPASQGFDAPAPVAATAAPLPPVKPVTGTAPISNETATNRATPTAGYAGNMDRIAAAHRLTESSNNYGALGPVNPNPKSDYYGDRAYGAYQVMGKNIPVWTKEILGRSMTPQEFLNNPEAQDAVYKAKMGQYVNQYGLDGALDKWLGSGKQDFTGTTHDKYREMFRTAMGQVGEDGDIPSNARLAQSRAGKDGYDVSGAPVPEKNWADRHGLSNPFGQSLTPQSDAKTGADSSSGSPSWWPFGKMSDATKQQLMATGFGMMASKSPFPGVALGEGGLQGISVAQKAQELSRQADLARAQIAGSTAETAGKNIANQEAQESLDARRAVRSNPLFGGGLSSPGSARAAPIGSAAVGPGQVLPNSQAPSVPNLATQPITDESMANTTKSATSVRNTVAGPIAYNSSGQPLENLAVTRAKAQVLINSGDPKFMEQGIKMQNHVDEVVKLGSQIMSDGSVGPIAGAAETAARAAGLKQTAETRAALEKEGKRVDENGNIVPVPRFAEETARAAGLKSGAEARAQAPFKILESSVQQGGRPIEVRPGQPVTTGNQLNPAAAGTIDWARQQIIDGTPGADPSVAPPTPSGIPAQGKASPQPLGYTTPQLVRNPDGSVISTANVATDEAAKEVSKYVGERQKALSAEGDTLYQAHQLRKALDGLPTGPGTELTNEASQFLSRFGLDVNKILPEGWKTDPTKSNVAIKNINQLAAAYGKANFPQRVTNADLNLAIRANVNLLNTPKANEILLDSMESLGRVRQEESQFYRGFMQNLPPGATPNWGIIDAWHNHLAKMPGVSDDIKRAYLSNSEQTENPQIGPRNEPKLPDGAVNKSSAPGKPDVYQFRSPGGGYYWSSDPSGKQ